MLTAPLTPPEGFVDDGAVGFALGAESDDEEESELGGLAEATHGVAASPTPIPNATANAPTRPTYLALLIIVSLITWGLFMVVIGDIGIPYGLLTVLVTHLGCTLLTGEPIAHRVFPYDSSANLIAE